MESIVLILQLYALVYVLWRGLCSLVLHPDRNLVQEIPPKIENTQFAENYRIPCPELREKIGKGGCATVYKGILHGQIVAVKQANDPHSILQEYEIQRSLGHKYIVRTIGISKDEKASKTHLVLEYAEDGSLEDLLFTNKVTLSLKRIVTLGLNIAKGLEYIHLQGIVHRDIKGANVLLYRNKQRAKIADFGAARFLDRSPANTIIGTLGFIAPEILEAEQYDKKVDIYSFGVLLFEMSSNTRMPVIMNEEKREERIKLKVTDPELQELILRCCRSKPIERPTMRQCIEVLKSIKARRN